MPIRVHAVDRPNLPPLVMPERFRQDIKYFVANPGEPGVPPLGAGEFWVRLEEARSTLDEGAIRVVSPLDSDNRTEIELSEDLERWLQWMVDNEIQHMRLQ